jgi:4-hydroxybenzoate polyprenyltransferase
MYWEFCFKKIKPYLQLARLDKPWGMVLLAFPTLSALVMTMTHFDATLCVVFVLGVVFTRSAGCVINDYADRWLDGEVARTQHRPLVSGTISPKQALWFLVVLGLACLSLLWFLPIPARVFALLAAGMIVLYPYTKRFLKAPQLFLGVVFSLGIPMAYLSQGMMMDLQGWGFLGNMIAWVVVYDTIYAMCDYRDDLVCGANTMAVALRGDISRFVGYGYGILSLSWIIWGNVYQMGGGYYIALVGVVYCYYLQYQLVVSKHYFQAFLLNTRGGLLLFSAVVLGVWGR